MNRLILLIIILSYGIIIGPAEAASSSSSSSSSITVSGGGIRSISVSASASAHARFGGFNNFFFWGMPGSSYGYGYGYGSWGGGGYGYYDDDMIELYRTPGVHPWRLPETNFSLQHNLMRHYYPEEVKDHPPVPPNTYSDPN